MFVIKKIALITLFYSILKKILEQGKTYHESLEVSVSRGSDRDTHVILELESRAKRKEWCSHILWVLSVSMGSLVTEVGAGLLTERDELEIARAISSE